MKILQSRYICCVPIELQDKWITAHLVWQTAASPKGVAGWRSRREMPLLRSISSYVGGELNSPLPLSVALSIYSLFECSLWSAHLFLRLIIGSGKLAYLHLAFRMTEESHKHKQTNEVLQWTILHVCMYLYVLVCQRETQKTGWCACIKASGKRVFKGII